MGELEHFSRCTIKVALFASVLSAGAACAATNGETQHKMDCSVYAQQEQVKLDSQRQSDPSIDEERLDTVFYSPKRNSCLASVFFTKGDTTYSGILDIVEGRMIWAKSYRGTSFSPAAIVAMDRDVDDEIKALEFTPAPDTSSNSRSFDLLPLLFDRTMNTFPAIKNAFTEAR
jgi:hypothetical protein